MVMALHTQNKFDLPATDMLLAMRFQTALGVLSILWRAIPRTQPAKDREIASPRDARYLAATNH